jgi:tetratricopeptide (TPR) repeat protein
MTRAHAMVLALGFAALAPAVARAETPVPDKAKALAERGRQLHHDGNYSAAIEAYKAAYVLAPSAALLYNLAQSYRLAGDCDDAAWMYRRYLESEPNEDMRALARTHLERLEKCAHGGLRVTDPAPPAVAQAQADVPSRAPGASPPTSSPLPPATESPPGHRSKQIGTWLVVGGGGALVIATLAALDAESAASSVSDAYNNRDNSTAVRATDDRGQRSATIATVFGIGGALAVVSGAVLYGIGRHYEHASHVAVVPHAGGATVSVAWGF